jgi:hypothetical protein
MIPLVHAPGIMSDISMPASRVGGERGSGAINSTYHFTTWLTERGREGGLRFFPLRIPFFFLTIGVPSYLRLGEVSKKI